MAGITLTDKQEISPAQKETFVQIGGKNFTVISTFEGTKTASQLLCDMAVSRVLFGDRNAETA
jgi:hypothetical protein